MVAAACGGFSLTISVDTATNTTKPPFQWRSGSKQMTVASIRHLSRPRRPDVISAPLLASYVGAGIRGRRVPVCDRCPQTWPEERATRSTPTPDNEYTSSLLACKTKGGRGGELVVPFLELAWIRFLRRVGRLMEAGRRVVGLDRIVDRGKFNWENFSRQAFSFWRFLHLSGTFLIPLGWVYVCVCVYIRCANKLFSLSFPTIVTCEFLEKY